MKSDRSSATRPGVARLRCAIYTRKSSEEGLDQSFNSLDAQREACESYIMSQVAEGWSALPTHYDDGGYSGGNMERPGLKQLLSDIAARKVDVVVVYKVDRLTRSLADFAKIVDVLDAQGASFVSVTQAFNTTSSMGRLTLNVLLSFAQFEREVTGERIRDKIAASKKKGMWMGGIPPLGYRPHERTLAIDEAEASTVRHIFKRYLALGSVHALKVELEQSGIRARPSKRTGEAGGPVLGRGALYYLLSNRLYLGEIVHKDQCYPGLHPPIVDQWVFDKAAALLAENGRERRERKVTADRAPLTGIIFDANGRPLCPATSRNTRGRLYRYYVSAHLQQGGRKPDDTGIRVPAPTIEKAVLDFVARLTPNKSTWAAARELVNRVEVEQDRLTITLASRIRIKAGVLPVGSSLDESEDGTGRISVPFRLVSWAGSSQLFRSTTQQRGSGTVDRSLVRALAKSHLLVRKARKSPDRTIEELSEEEGASASYVRRLSRIAFLAPEIQQAILDGRHPPALNLERLMRLDLPLSWERQREILGIS